MANQVAGQGQSFAALKHFRKEKLEEGVHRLSHSKGVWGVMVTTDKWKIIESTFQHNLGHYLKREMKLIEHLGTCAVRDADTFDELQFVRVQTSKFEMLLSIADDHRVLAVFNNSEKDPLKICAENVKRMKREHLQMVAEGKAMRRGIDPCLPHTKKIGGKDQIKIIEKIMGKDMDQDDDVNNQP